MPRPRQIIPHRKTCMLGSNIRPGMVPGGFTTQFGPTTPTKEYVPIAELLAKDAEKVAPPAAPSKPPPPLFP